MTPEGVHLGRFRNWRGRHESDIPLTVVTENPGKVVIVQERFKLVGGELVELSAEERVAALRKHQEGTDALNEELRKADQALKQQEAEERARRKREFNDFGKDI